MKDDSPPPRLALAHHPNLRLFVSTVFHTRHYRCLSHERPMITIVHWYFDLIFYLSVGMNLAVVFQGETVYTQGYGVIDRKDNETVTNDTFFGIASLTKAFTATLLGQLLHRHK